MCLCIVSSSRFCFVSKTTFCLLDFPPQYRVLCLFVFVLLPCCLNPCLPSCHASTTSPYFHPPSATRWDHTPPRIAQYTLSPAPHSGCCGRIQPWPSKAVGLGTSGTSHDPSRWQYGAAGGTRTAVEPGRGLYQTCRCSGNTWLKKTSWLCENSFPFLAVRMIVNVMTIL